jgi:hypothetical protein
MAKTKESGRCFVSCSVRKSAPRRCSQKRGTARRPNFTAEASAGCVFSPLQTCCVSRRLFWLSVWSWLRPSCCRDICDCLASLTSESTTMPSKKWRPPPAPPLKSLRGLERFRLTGNQVSQLIGWWQFADQSALRNHRSHLLSLRARSTKSNKTGFPGGSRQPRNCCAQPAMNCLGSFRK